MWFGLSEGLPRAYNLNVLALLWLIGVRLLSQGSLLHHKSQGPSHGCEYLPPPCDSYIHSIVLFSHYRRVSELSGTSMKLIPMYVSLFVLLGNVAQGSSQSIVRIHISGQPSSFRWLNKAIRHLIILTDAPLTCTVLHCTMISARLRCMQPTTAYLRIIPSVISDPLPTQH